jgi:hypothetical protein
MPEFTLLSIDGITIPDYAARRMVVTVTPEDNGSMERDVNGILVDLTLTSFHKLHVSIAGSDKEAPTLNGIFRGSGPYVVTLIPNTGVSDSTDGTLTLTMRVDTWNSAAQDWEATTDWRIDLIEV